MRIFYFIVLVLNIGIVSAQSLDELKKQRAETEKAIEFTNKLIKNTQKDAAVSINKLTVIGKQIENRQKLISGITKEINYINNDIVEKKNNISNLQRR